jgi:FkbH-like protein
MKDIKYSEILKINKSLYENLSDESYQIKVLSNINTSQLNEILEYTLRTNSVPAIVESGEYDNIVQDSLNCSGFNLVIIFWELSNIVNGFQYKSELLEESQLSKLIKELELNIEFVLKNIKKSSLVIINKFSALSFSNNNLRKTNIEKLATTLNEVLLDYVGPNIKIVDLEKVIAMTGINDSLDLRYFYSSKALYTIKFYKNYVEFIKPLILSTNGLSKKALILDCDNTIWRGILGEDGFDAIEMSPETAHGSVYSEVQSIVLSLKKQGVLIGLCSKNNYEDVVEVIANHPDMQLRENHISILKVNWNDKAANLREISNELNIGLDSMVFVDDSSFEVNLVKENLPEIKVFQVPKNIYDYPSMMNMCQNLFYSLSTTDEDSNRVDMYKQAEKREKNKESFTSLVEYLSSLQLEIFLHKDLLSVIPRLSQMTQKTNQFNTTTKRYTENDIEKFIKDTNVKIFAFTIKDKFGSYGITSLIIVNKIEEYRANLDTFLLSCRVIGRNLEFALMDFIINSLKKENIKLIEARYIKTLKNQQVSRFYDSCCFSRTDFNEDETTYRLNIGDYKANNLEYIRFIDVN